VQTRVVLGTGTHDGAEQRVVVTGQDLRRAVQHEVRAVLDRAQQDRAEHRVVDDHDGSGGVRGGDRHVQIGEGQHRVRARLEPDEVGVGRLAGLVERRHVQAPPSQLVLHDGVGPEVASVGDRDSGPGAEHGEDQRRRGA
jgi:hypothetical protein